MHSLGVQGTQLFDMSGNGNHGTLTNMDPATDWSVNQFGIYLDFDGVDDMVSFASKPADQITIVGMVKSDADGDSKYPRIVEMPGYLLIGNRDSGAGNDNSLEFVSLRSGNNGDWYSPVDSFPHGSTISFAVNYDSSLTANNPTLWIDGISQAVTETVTPSGSQQSNAGTGYLGNRAAANRSFDGRMHNIMYYKRILSGDEIQQLYLDPLAPFRQRTSKPMFVPSPPVGGGYPAAYYDAVHVQSNPGMM
ncbi:MAG: LamG-like jellyroll fold domain-containing protein [bacterium]